MLHSTINEWKNIYEFGEVTVVRLNYFDPTSPFLLKGETFSIHNDLTAIGCFWVDRHKGWTVPIDVLPALLSCLRSRDSGEEAYPTADSPASARDYELAEEPDLSGWSTPSQPTRRSSRRLQRLVMLPPELWTDEEVLEILLGYAFPDLDPGVAGWLLERFGGLGAAMAAEAPRFAEHPTFAAQQLAEPAAGDVSREIGFLDVASLLKAVGQVALRSLREEIKDRPVIGSWAALIDYLKLAMQHDAAEHFRILFLDRKNILIRDEVQSRGTVDHTPLYPREVVKRALELAASAIIMVHNHPSGDPTPSQADIDMTRQVIGALAQVSITVHDHIIVGKNRHTSFKTQRLI